MPTLEGQFFSSEPSPLTNTTLETVRMDENRAILVHVLGGEIEIDSSDLAQQVTLSAINTKLVDQATAAKQQDILSAIQGLNGKFFTTDTTNQVIPVIQRRLALNTYALSVFRNLGANNTLNIKNVLGNVFCAAFTNKNVATRYFQLWDTTSTAGNGSLLEEFVVPGSSQLILGQDYFDINGTYFATGIAFGFSSTSTTFTGATAADQNTVIKYL